MKTFEIEFTMKVEIEIDESLLPNDEWRSNFYDIHTLEQMAEHIAWNKCVRHFDNVEGIAKEDEKKFKILSIDWDNL